MLPLELLRVRTNRGKITPQFCLHDYGNGSDYELANRLISYFMNTQKMGGTLGALQQKGRLLESEYDHKLVRGLFTLLERRSSFKNSSKIDSFLIRKSIFEESSKKGLGLSESQRNEIILLVANQKNLSAKDVESAMWGDLEENLVVDKFETLSANELIAWYNLSLMQTLLFRCTHLEFYIKGGKYWKRLLRQVKRYGLMYSLRKSPIRKTGEDSLLCMLEGPSSLFKMTDRYGTAIAKILPLVVSSPDWEMKTSILRKTDDGKKIYQFEITSKSVQSNNLITPLPDFISPTNNNNIESQNYDSSLEEKFANTFKQFNHTNWKISREPDPLISDGKAMIPDFLFENFGRKVYLEIVGFWTKEYLQRKASKLESIYKENRTVEKHKKIDLIVAVNGELACSSIKSIASESIFTFKREVPIKPILEHLKRIDKEIIEQKSQNTRINDSDKNSDILSIEKIAKKYDMPEQAVIKILSEEGNDNSNRVIAGKYMISKNMARQITKALLGISKFVEACAVLQTFGIPDSCYADLISELGFDVIWSDLNPKNASIVIKTKTDVAVPKI